jgi:hypothetical protein
VKPSLGTNGCIAMAPFTPGQLFFMLSRCVLLHQYEDPKGALFKLCQTTTVREYQKAFESLANRITKLPPQFYLSCFISGLRADIRREVLAF